MNSPELISKLDLLEFINNFNFFLARDKPLFIGGDINIHHKFIKELENYNFTTPSQVSNLTQKLTHIKKNGVLKLDEIFEFIKIIRYFLYLKEFGFKNIVATWIEKINIPKSILEIEKLFDKYGKLLDSVDERLLEINKNSSKLKEQIRTTLQRIFSSSKIIPYLVDRQIHLINDSEALLVRGGFNHIIKAKVVGRSSSGFFYITPHSINELKSKEEKLFNKKLEIIYEYEKKISNEFNKQFLFLRFIDREFDKFDNYQARVNFAKSYNLNFILPNNKNELILKNFAHPALKNPKKIDIDFSKQIFLITGVNAGGKTMLLKSILTASFLSKYLIPLDIDSTNSKIPSFKEIIAILDDPQNVKNDISTFAGRMLEFSKLFGKKNVIVGIDEIELGTDSDEAATLFSVILNKLKSNIKIIITTHHKRLASLMAKERDVELVAALYNLELQKPTFEFLQGTIGKSYAFETASRYGIPHNIIKEVKFKYGKDSEKLNDLIQKNIELELNLRDKITEYDKKLQRVEKLEEQLITQKQSGEERLSKIKEDFEKEYQQVLEEAKKTIKSKDSKEIHRQLNIAHKRKSNIKKIEAEIDKTIKIGDIIKYRNSKGVITDLKKNTAFIDCDGIKLRVPLSDVKKSSYQKPKKPIKKISFSKPKTASIKLDLHGQRVEEALINLDKFLNDALLGGFDEILVYHGIGTGKLSVAVKEFLEEYPSVKSFTDAPPNMGGFGAKIIKL